MVQRARETCDDLYSKIWRQRNRIKDLEARLADNQAELISKLRDKMFITLEEPVDVASWTESRQNQEIRCLEEMVDSKNISEMEESPDWNGVCLSRDSIKKQ